MLEGWICSISCQETRRNRRNLLKLSRRFSFRLLRTQRLCMTCCVQHCGENESTGYGELGGSGGMDLHLSHRLQDPAPFTAPNTNTKLTAPLALVESRTAALLVGGSRRRATITTDLGHLRLVNPDYLYGKETCNVHHLFSSSKDQSASTYKVLPTSASFAPGPCLHMACKCQRYVCITCMIQQQLRGDPSQKHAPHDEPSSRYSRSSNQQSLP
jgi:hypothetical protein